MQTANVKKPMTAQPSTLNPQKKKKKQNSTKTLKKHKPVSTMLPSVSQTIDQVKSKGSEFTISNSL
jgi:hypothetical protein